MRLNIVPLVLLLTLLVDASDALACVKFESASHRLFNGKDKSSKKQELVKQIYDHMVKVNDVIPNLSPAEKKWLESEMSAKDTTRRVKALFGTESLLEQAKEGVTALVVFSKQILDGNYRHQRGEVELWALIATMLIDSRITQDLVTLHERKVITIPDLSASGERAWPFSCSITARNIMGSIVIPYLQGD